MRIAQLRDLCREKGVAFFVKQLGRRPFVGGVEQKLKDTHGGDWDEWPEEFRIREMPNYFYEYGGLPKPTLLESIPGDDPISNRGEIDPLQTRVEYY